MSENTQSSSSSAEDFLGEDDESFVWNLIDDDITEELANVGMAWEDQENENGWIFDSKPCKGDTENTEDLCLIMITLCSARMTKRIGWKSPIKNLPIELLRSKLMPMIEKPHVWIYGGNGTHPSTRVKLIDEGAFLKKIKPFVDRIQCSRRCFHRRL